MLPPGHIAAGFLTAQAVIQLAHPAITPIQYRGLLLVGALVGFLPDLDFFIVFLQARSFTVPDEHLSAHRKFFSHAPLLWLAAGLIIYFIAPHPAWKMVGLILWLASWSHFILDSVVDKIKWLWPFSQKSFGLFPVKPEKDFSLSREPFLKFWGKFIKEYIRTRWIIVLAEFVFIIIGIYQIHKLVIK